MTTIIFSILFSFASWNNFHYKYSVSLMVGIPFMAMAMKKFKESSFKVALVYLVMMLVVVIGVRFFIDGLEGKIAEVPVDLGKVEVIG